MRSAAAGAGRDEQVRFLVLQVGDPLATPDRVAKWTRWPGSLYPSNQARADGAGGCHQVAANALSWNPIFSP